MVRRRRVYRRPALFRRHKALAVALCLLIALLLRYFFPQGEPGPPDALAEGPYPVERVIDGDTLLLPNGVRIRLIGADTPETVKPNHPVEPWGPEATAFTREFLAGHQVRLQFDRERKDQYGRFLAYVWVDERMLNEELIRAGLARAKTGFPYSASMKTRFRRAEEEARAERRNIWSTGQSP